MFAARCIAVSLTFFVLLYSGLSLAASLTWELMRRVQRPFRIPGSASLLLGLRILPLLGAFSITVAFSLPSFLLFEPRSTDEAIGILPLALGFCSLLLLAAGISRASSAQARASQAVAEWLNGATMMEKRGSAPVFRTGEGTPLLTVAGVRAPKILVSETAVSALSGPELHAALRHELAHVRHRDNLKKLVFQFSPFPGMKRLERAWSEAAEMDADDAAVSNLPEALDLAAALIKLSRLAPVQTPELAAGLLHNPACSVSARVDRLFRWDESRIALSDRSRAWYALVPTLAIGACVLLTYNSVLTGMHTVTEWLVR